MPSSKKPVSSEQTEGAKHIPHKFLEYELGLIVSIGGTTKEVHESVRKGSDFNLVKSNLKELFELGATVSVKMNPTKANLHQLASLPDFIERLGGPRASILPYTTCFPLPSEATREEINYFFDEIVSNETNPYLRFTYDLSKPEKCIKAKVGGCNYLMDVIFFDGQMSVCCHDQLQKINVGNVFEQSIEEIKASGAYKVAIASAKRCAYDFCKGCN